MNNPSSPPPFPSRLWSLIALVAASGGVPAATLVFFSQRIVAHPRLALLGFVLYEMAIIVLGFVLEVGQKLQSRWVDRCVEWLDDAIKRRLSGYYKIYTRYLYHQHRDFDVKGLTTLGTYALELNQIFVELRLDPTTLKQMSVNPIAHVGTLAQRNHVLWDYLQSKSLSGQHLVIIGPPGSGKTTLLKHVTLTLATKHRWGRQKRMFISQRLPILLFLRDLAENIKDRSDFSLIQALQDHLRKWEQPEPPVGWVKRRLATGQCLIMLDGLDEVADPEMRLQVVDWVQRQMIAFHQNRFIISSRPFGYRSNPLSGVVVLEVRPFSYEQVERFVNKWYLANEMMSKQKDDAGVRMKARAEAKDLLRRLQNTPALSALTVNPLLLTMIATVHRYNGELPGKRVALYAEICEVFLGKRQQARGQILELTPAQIRLVLGSLAYALMLNGKRDMTTEMVCDAIKEPLARVRPSMTCQEFLQLVQNVSGLLLERENGVYSFAHLTFQEYLTAVHIHEKQLVDTLIPNVEESWWQETIRLYCAISDATPILATCLRDDPPSVHALITALMFDEEARDIHPTVKARLECVLSEGVEHSDPERRRIVAEALLARRQHQMIYVREGLYRATSLVTCAEYQLFLDEQQQQGKYCQPDHWRALVFPNGSGTTPVLGIRHSDAQEFCDWLTARSEEGWHYHLPCKEDWPLEQRRKELPADTGYWVVDETRFAWSRGTPSDVLRQQIIDIIHHIFSHDSDLAHTRARDLVHARDLFRNFAFYSKVTHDLDRTLIHGFDFARARDHRRSLDLAHDLTRACNRAFDRSRAHVRDIDITLARSRVLDITLARSRVLDITLVSDYILDLDRCLASDYASNSDHYLNLLLYLLCCKRVLQENFLHGKVFY